MTDKETIDNLTAENEELKKQVCGLRPELKGLINDICCKYNIKAKTYHEKIVEIIYYLNKYNQTLTKIKDIANYSFNRSISVYMAKLELILEKISEVKNEQRTKGPDRYKQALKEIKQIILNIRNDEDFVGEGKLWQMIFDIEKIIIECEVQNDKMQNSKRRYSL